MGSIAYVKKADYANLLAENERLRAEVKQCSVELGEAAKLLSLHFSRTAGIYEEACGRARVAIGLTPCDVEQKVDDGK
jgi:hypothetical protein